MDSLIYLIMPLLMYALISVEEVCLGPFLCQPSIGVCFECSLLRSWEFRVF